MINNAGDGPRLLTMTMTQLTSTTLVVVEVCLSHVAYGSLQRYM